MKLLFDQNLSHKLALILGKEFPDSTHVREVGLASADDLAVWEYARKFGFAIVSKDADFSQRSFLFGFPPKVIWIKMGNCSTQQIETALKVHLADILTFASSPEAFLIIDPSLETLLEKDSQKAKSIRVPVESAAIVSIGYDRQSRTLEVEFKTGVVYQYFEVPETVYKELLSAPSKGAYMNSKIKLRYRFQMVL